MRHTTFNHQFTSSRGNVVRVFRTHEVAGRNWFRGRTGVAVEAWAEVCGVRVPVQAGATFTAVRAVREAGF